MSGDTERLEPNVLRSLATAKELDISEHFPARGQKTEVSMTRVLLSNGTTAKKLLHTCGKQYLISHGNVFIRSKNFRIAVGHQLD